MAAPFGEFCYETMEAADWICRDWLVATGHVLPQNYSWNCDALYGKGSAGSNRELERLLLPEGFNSFNEWEQLVQNFRRKK